MRLQRLFLFLDGRDHTRLGAVVSDETGNVKAGILSIIGGVITLVVGMVLFTTILTQAASSGANANIGSFSGAQSLNDLIPLVYIAAIVMVGVGLIGIGAMGIRNNGG